MRVFLSVASFAPEHGGPAVSVSTLGVRLANEGHDVALYAPDGSALSSPVIDRLAPPPTLSRHGADWRDALAAFGPLDVIHDNGVWLPHNHGLARYGRRERVPRLVSLRGMLEPWAFRHKRWKKRAAFTLYQRRDLALADAIHATSDVEASNFARFGIGRPVHVVPNGMDLPALGGKANEAMGGREGSDDGARTILFLGRIHPVKGLANLLQAFARLGPRGWRLRLVGPQEGGHRAELEALAARCGIAADVSFEGPVYGEEKRRLYAEADVFALPSHTENFGMAAAEALAHGVPVLTTTGTPWQAVVEARCGWRVEPTVEGMTEGLGAALAVDHRTRAEMGRRGRELIATRYAWDAVLARMIALYVGLRSDKPG